MEERQIVERSIGKYDELDSTANMYSDLSGTARQEGTDTDANGKAWTASELRAALKNGKLIKDQNLVSSYFINHTYFWGDRHYEMFLGQDRAERISPLRSALKRGIPFSNHNDTFVTPIDPLLSVWSAVNRRTSGGRILGENQTIPVMDALRSVTSWAAYQACEERIKGSLEPGKLADFVILEANPLTVAKETIKDIGISATIVGDEVVYGSLD